MIINAENAILGRLASFAAKKALLGEKVIIVNSEKVIITGDKYMQFAQYKRKRDMGTFKGPFLLRTAPAILKRTIRGMLPYKQSKGRVALNNITCYTGIPDEYKDQEQTRLDDKKVLTRFVTLFDVCKFLGGRQ